MAFDSLSEKLQNIFKKLRGKGRLSADDVKTAMKEVKMALLEADVNFKVVKQFVNTVSERAVGQDVMSSLTPGQMVIKIVNEEMVALMGSETTEISFVPGAAPTVIMMAGLQGAGKTTTTAKIAGKLKEKGKRPLLVACDVYRPAAIKQLQINGEKQGVPVFEMGDNNKPVDIAKAALAHAQKNNNNVVILDTAGRLHVDEDMMNELKDIKEAVNIHFRDIGQDPNQHDVTYENGQARERTQILMDIANKNGGLVIGTGDTSELALGWATYNGDHMSNYAVNCGVPKTLVKYIVQTYAAEKADTKNMCKLLCEIANLPISPELLPSDKDGNIVQKTEDSIGKYDLHDFFLYHFLRNGSNAARIQKLAEIAFPDIDKNEIEKTLHTFFNRFRTQQFKRSCIPDGPKVGTISLSPRGDLRMPSDMQKLY